MERGPGAVSGGLWVLLAALSLCQWRDRKAVLLPIASMGGGGGEEDSAISALVVVALRRVSRSKAAVVQLPTCLHLLLVLAFERKTALKNITSEKIRWRTADTGVPLKRTHGDLVRAVSGLCIFSFLFLPEWLKAHLHRLPP